MNQRLRGTAIAGAILTLYGYAAMAAAQTTGAPAAEPKRFDFNGYWSAGEFNFGGGAARPSESKDISMTAPLRNGDIANLTNDNVLLRRSGDNLPLYKPEHWDKVVDLDWNGNQMDPFNHCMPVAPPRLELPRKIVVLPNEVLMFYSVIFQPNDFRIIPFGARTHEVDRDGTWRGDSIAHWEGDTLVIETEGFNADSWFGPEGYFHGYEMKTTERFRPEGDTLVYQVTVEDPEVLVKPWITDAKTLRRVTKPTYMEEAPPCSERDNQHIVGKQREM